MNFLKTSNGILVYKQTLSQCRLRQKISFSKNCCLQHLFQQKSKNICELFIDLDNLSYFKNTFFLVYHFFNLSRLLLIIIDPTFNLFQI